MTLIYSILSFLWSLLSAISDYIGLFVDFLYSFFVLFPIKLLGFLGDLPLFMSVGLSSLISVIIVVSVIKLISYVK